MAVLPGAPRKPSCRNLGCRSTVVPAIEVGQPCFDNLPRGRHLKAPNPMSFSCWKGGVMTGTMFERYGGFAKVNRIVMAFYDKALDSDLIGDFFENIDMPAQIDHQTKFISYIMGGPASYTNEQLQRVHAHLKINTEAFEEMASLLKQTLEDFELDPADIDQIIDEIRGRAAFIVNA
jgi:hemoglobin